MNTKATLRIKALYLRGRFYPRPRLYAIKNLTESIHIHSRQYQSKTLAYYVNSNTLYSVLLQ